VASICPVVTTSRRRPDENPTARGTTKLPEHLSVAISFVLRATAQWSCIPFPISIPD